MKSSTPKAAILAVVALVMSFFVLSFTEMKTESATADEVVHVPSGFAYVSRHDFRFNPEHPVLIKAIAGWSVAAFTAAHINTTSPAWRQDDEWRFAWDFLYHTPGNDPEKILFWARLPMLLIGAAAIPLAFMWARDLYGWRAGLGAATLFALDPTMIAHSHLVATDVGLTTLTSASLYCLWKQQKSNRNVWLWLGGVALGLALATKFSALFLIPAVLAIQIVAARMTPRQALAYWIKVGAAALLTVIAVYAVVAGPRALPVLLSLPHLYATGIEHVVRTDASNKVAYILGRTYHGGYWAYYPLLLLIKLPLITLTALGAACIFRLCHRQAGMADELWLILPASIFILLGMVSSLDIGLRYIFPALPLLFVFASQILNWKPLRQAWVLPALVIALGLAVWSAFPYCLTYVNDAFGGPANGYKVAADSNYDWGQDLLRLKDWQLQQGVPRLDLYYFGDIETSYYGFENLAESARVPAMSHGYTAVSATAMDYYYGGAKAGWRINGVAPIASVGNSILIYNLR